MALTILEWTATAIVLAAVLPLIVAAIQTLSTTFHYRTYLKEAVEYTPRVAVLIPAWNEAPVIPATIERMLGLDYPEDNLRVFIIDDASTDATPEIMTEMIELYGPRVVHIRRENGGQGKAHTLNAGLNEVLANDWAQAILITDADVLFTPESLAKMARHFADPQVGAVTGYVKEGTQPAAQINKFIAYEYSTAQAVTRRAMNMLGAQACLAGGAQLHRRENIEQIGGQIDTGTLAEDTVTTFETQLRGSTVVFEPNAEVYAEEPGGARALWGQRVRWGRGNLQVSSKYRWLWFRKSKHPKLGTFRFGISWFIVLMQPFLLIASSICLLFLYFVDAEQQFAILRMLWITSGVVYAIIIFGAWSVDPKTLKRTWPQAILFPGIVSTLLVFYSIFPTLFSAFGDWALGQVHLDPAIEATGSVALAIAVYSWLALSMVVSYLGKVAEKFRFGGKQIGLALIFLGGYGSLLCAVTFAAVVAEMSGRKQVWVKTEKTGKVAL